ncbi:MAG: ComEC/Rec2 family competence protein [Candidatus Paceibacterota bacterium]
MNNFIFYSITLGFLAGVFLCLLLNLTLYIAPFFLLLGVTSITLLLAGGIQGDSPIITALFCTAFALGILCGLSAGDVHTPALDPYVETEVELVGVVATDPAWLGDRQNFLVRIESVEGREVEARGRITLRAYPRVEYGDRLHLSGKLSVPEDFISEDTGRLVAYEEYLATQGVGYQMIYPEVEIVARGAGSGIQQTLFSIKHVFLERIGRFVPEPQSALLGGMTVGAEEALGEELEEDFRDTGLIHIVVLSGYNVTIIADVFMRLASFLPLLVRSLLGSVGIILFALLVGASATIIRASIMALIVVFARVIGRPHHILRALILAAVGMVIVNPRIIAYDPGFQLSFLATAGLIFLAPVVEYYISRVPSRFEIKESIAATVSTQIFVLPLLLYMTGVLSIASLPVNVLGLPAVPLAMLFGALIAVFSYLGPIIVLPFAIAGNILSAYIIRVVELFAALPFTTVELPTVSIWVVVLWYVVIGIGVWWWMQWRGVDKKMV